MRANHARQNHTNDTSRLGGEAGFSSALMRSIVKVSFLLVGGIALLNLFLWFLDLWGHGTFGSNYIPMAPSTALLLLIIVSVVFMRQYRRDSIAVSRLTSFAILIAMAMSIVVVIEFIFGFNIPIESWLSQTLDTVGKIPVGRMSALTAVCFLLASLAYVCAIAPRNRGWAKRQFGALFALLVLLVGFAVVSGYALGVPFLYGSTVVPMAALTGVSFFLLGLGLLLEAGIEVWPMNLIFLSAQDNPSALRFVGGTIALLLLCTFLIGSEGWFYYRYNKVDLIRETHESLSIIADLKVDQIAGWMKERRGDASIIFKTRLVWDEIHHFLTEPDNAAKSDELLEWMTIFQQDYDYSEVILFDAQGVARLVAPADTSLMQDPHIEKHIQVALHAREVVFEDLHHCRSNTSIHLSFLIPIGIKSQADQPADGVLLLVVDPQQFLYPLVQNWPTSSPSAETLLVRREGNDVVFLNNLRHRANTAMVLRLPISDPNLLAAMAVLGQQGMVEGMDYRGIPVLAAFRKVPGMPWFMVTKVDQEEAYAGLYQQAWITVSITGLLLLAVMLGFGLLWRQQRLIIVRRELVLRKTVEKKLKNSESRTRAYLENSPACTKILDLNFNLQYMSSAGIKGLKIENIEDYYGKPYPFDFYPTSFKDMMTENLEKVRKTGDIIEQEGSVFVDGDEVWFHSTISLVCADLDHMDYIIVVSIDITERKLGEKELLEKNAELERFSYAVSHDLRSPLVTIRTFTGYLEKDFQKQDTDRIAKDFMFIRSASEKMSLLLDELLALTRVGRVKNVESNAPLQDIVQEALTLVAGRIAERGVIVEITPQPLVLRGDRMRLVEVFQNLIDNAVKFMGEQSQPHVDIGWKRKDDENLLFVRDNGMGIDQRYQGKAFNLFEKIDSGVEGTGIGLALVKRIVETHGGRIWVESAGLGQGACFWFTLPGKK